MSLVRARAAAVLTSLLLAPGFAQLAAQVPRPVAAQVVDGRLAPPATVPSGNAFSARSMTGREAARAFFVGALVGAAAGGVVGYMTCDHCDEPMPVVAATGIGAVVGGVVGLIVQGYRISRVAAARAASAPPSNHPSTSRVDGMTVSPTAPKAR
jgi:hypothetical protein